MKISRLSIGICISLLTLFFPLISTASEFSSSIWGGIGEGAHGDNGTLIVGVDLKTNILTGYYESSDLTGNVVAECKFFFEGKLRTETTTIVPIEAIGVHSDLLEEKTHISIGRIERQSDSGKPVVTIYLSHIPRSCDWLYYGLPGYKPPKNFVLKNGLPSEFLRKGNWRSVRVIRSKRSYFHAQPQDASRGKTYLVAGDLIYIYDEISDWYYAEYQSEKKVTRGWVRKTDAIQIADLH